MSHSNCSMHYTQSFTQLLVGRNNVLAAKTIGKCNFDQLFQWLPSGRDISKSAYLLRFLATMVAAAGY